MRLFLSIAILISAVSVANAQVTEPWENYGEGGTDYFFTSDSDYIWLYEALIPENLRQQLPDESFKSFRVHLKDSYYVFPNPENLKKIHLNKSARVTGQITYAGIFPKDYFYSVSYGQKGDLEIAVRIHLRGLKEGEKADFAAKVQQAEDLWNQGRPEYDFKYSFRFMLVDDQDSADFSVLVLDSTRGPYDSYWSRQWTGRAIAHEIGHMMGLGDEYRTITGTIDCLEQSLMCDGWYGDTMGHHYYFILRRLVQPVDEN